MKILTRTGLGILAVILAAGLHYTLPQVDVVRVLDTEVRRVDADTPQDGGRQTRDVYFIQTESLDGDPHVYRNEDNLVYGKIASADLQARMQAFARDDTVVAVRHYGWRIRLFSMFPNAVAAWPVEPGYRHIPYFNIAVLTLLAAGGALGYWRLRKAGARRAERAAEREAEARRQREAEAARRKEELAAETAQAEGERRDVDAFLSGDGSGNGRG